MESGKVGAGSRNTIEHDLTSRWADRDLRCAGPCRLRCTLASCWDVTHSPSRMRVVASPLLRLVLTLGLFAASPVPRLVLCVGTDGHRAIEPWDADCCKRVSDSAGMRERCARTCTDLPLSLGVGLQAGDRGGLTIDRPVSAVPGHSPALLATWTLTPLEGGAAPTPPLAHHPRSTVLLC